MIKIYPLDQIISNNKNESYYLDSFYDMRVDLKLNDIIGDFKILKSGKDAIRAIIEELNIDKSDEVYIDTTLNNSYVSTCVSATIFNYCKISRVITKNTKVIFVIHTFSHPNPRIYELREYCNENGLILIEDCISSFDTFDNFNNRMGSIGDYSIYSVPKIFPSKYGGILTSKLKNNIINIYDDYILNQILKWEKYLTYLKELKINRYELLDIKFKTNLYNSTASENPFMFGFYNNFNYKERADIEYGLTHVKNEIHIPINAFADIDNYKII